MSREAAGSFLLKRCHGKKSNTGSRRVQAPATLATSLDACLDQTVLMCKHCKHTHPGNGMLHLEYIYNFGQVQQCAIRMWPGRCLLFGSIFCMEAC